MGSKYTSHLMLNPSCDANQWCNIRKCEKYITASSHWFLSDNFFGFCNVNSTHLLIFWKNSSTFQCHKIERKTSASSDDGCSGFFFFFIIFLKKLWLFSKMVYNNVFWFLFDQNSEKIGNYFPDSTLSSNATNDNVFIWFWIIHHYLCQCQI
jgi:hypothetical protein